MDASSEFWIAFLSSIFISSVVVYMSRSLQDWLYQRKLQALQELEQLQAESFTNRNPDWPAASRRFRLKHPTCAACGTRDNLQVHHILPFHAFPTLEMAESNWIVLCHNPEQNYSCHYYIGHLLNWRAWNPNVIQDAAEWLKKIKARKIISI